MATDPEILEIALEWQQKHAPKGLILSNDPDGVANGSIINAHIMKNGGVVSFESLSQAAEAQKLRLNWLPGFEPKPPAKIDRRSKFDQCVDAGFLPNRAEGSTHASRNSEAEAAKRAADAQRVRDAEVARQKSLKDVEDARREQAEIITGPTGRIDWAKTFALREEYAKKRAVANGQAPPVPNTVREIPTDRELTRAEMNQFTPEELRRHLEKQRRGRGY